MGSSYSGLGRAPRTGWVSSLAPQIGHVRYRGIGHSGLPLSRPKDPFDWGVRRPQRRVKVGLALPDSISTSNETGWSRGKEKRMLEVERADALVNAAFGRVQGLDRFSRSAPIGKAELAAIVLQGLAELGALADWTVMPGVTESVLRLLDDDERL